MLVQWSIVWPSVGMSDTPATASGRWLLVFPSGTSVALRDTETVCGNPVRKELTPLMDHPPHRVDRPKGNGYLMLPCRLCRWSDALLAQSHARQLTFWTGLGPPPPCEFSFSACPQA